MSFGKSSTKSNTQQQQAGTEAQSATPNNLPYLQQGWNAAAGILDPSSPVSNAAALALSGANNAQTAAQGATTTAGNIANSGAPNAANGYLTPFANGSMTGSQNPFFQNLVDQVTRSAQQSTDGGMAASGRYGSGANANAFNSAVANETGQLGYANFNDSLNRQLQAGQQLSTNSTNSTNAALQALGLVPGLTTASTNAGAAAVGAASSPTSIYTQLLEMLGAGGGTSTGNSSGTASGTGSSNTSAFQIAPKFSLGPFSFGG